MRKLSAIFFDILLRIFYIKTILKAFRKYIVAVFVLLIALFFVLMEWFKTFEIKEIVEYKQSLLYLAHDYPLALSVSFFLAYVLISTISLPGTTVLNIIGGFLFGFVKGTVLAIFAISIGSSFAFLLTRFFLRDFFIKRGGVKMKKIHNHLNENEIYYLFAFRLFPFTPLFFTNMIMGLSSIRLSVFYIISFITLLPQLAIYANIGSQISQLEELQGLIEPNLLFAFSLIGLFPLSVKYMFKFFKKFKKAKSELPLESDDILFG